MKIVEFQHIQSGVRKLAAVKETLEHLQEAYKEAAAFIMYGLTAFSDGSTRTPLMLFYGCLNSSTAPVYNISAGVVWYNGELYEVPAFSGTASGSNVPVLSINTTYASSDPALYKNASGASETFNTHSIRKLLWSFAPSGSGISDFAGLLTFKFILASRLGNSFAAQGVRRAYTNQAIIGNPATAAEWNLINLSLPAFYLTTNNVDRLRIKLTGAYGATANVKTIRITLNGANIFNESGAINGVAFEIDIDVIRLDVNTGRVIARWNYMGKTSIHITSLAIPSFNFDSNQSLIVHVTSSGGAADDIRSHSLILTTDPIPS